LKQSFEGAQMQYLETQTDGTIGTIIIDHPRTRNALSRQLINAFLETLDRLSRERVRSIVLRARPGAKVWSSGHDVAKLPEGGRDPLGWDDPLRHLVRATIEEHPSPTPHHERDGVHGNAHIRRTR
jgi:methylmalonyl-CoA decarboxylase